MPLEGVFTGVLNPSVPPSLAEASYGGHSPTVKFNINIWKGTEAVITGRS
jgi:hypothetical protein